MSVASELDLRRYIVIVRRWVWLLVVATIVAAGVSLVVSSSIPKTYLATLTLVVGDDTANLHPSVDDVTVSQRLASVYSGMVTREPILTATINALHLPTTWSELQRRVLVIRGDGSQIIEIRVNDSDPARTRATVDELARQLTLQSPTAENSEELDHRREFVRQQLERIQANIQDAEGQLTNRQAALSTETSARGVLDLQDEIKALELNLTNWRSSYAAMLSTNISRGPNTLTVIQPSLVPTQPVGPNTRANVLLGAMLGLIAALIGVAIIEFLRGVRLVDTDGVTRTLGQPVLGTIGKIAGPAPRPTDRLVGLRAPQSAVAEDYRRLRTNLQFAWGSASGPVTLLVTSSGPREGKSVTSANLAVAWARSGKRTILVDADLAHPSVHHMFDVENNAGLLSLFWADSVVETDGQFISRPGDLLGALRQRLNVLLQPTQVPGLRLLTAGPSLDESPSDLLTSEDGEHLLAALNGLADVIILDGPPVLVAAETARLAALSLGVLIVVEAGETRADVARLMHEELVRAGAHVLGVVLNKAKTLGSTYYPSYYRRDSQRRDRQQGQSGARAAHR